MVSEVKQHREESRLTNNHSMRHPDFLYNPAPERRRFFEAFAEFAGEARKLEHIRQDFQSGEMALLILSVYQRVGCPIITDPGGRAMICFTRPGNSF